MARYTELPEPRVLERRDGSVVTIYECERCGNEFRSAMGFEMHQSGCAGWPLAMYGDTPAADECPR